LHLAVNSAKENDENLLAAMAQDIDEQIDLAQQELKVLKEKVGAI
jgi:hypothetical protein